MIQGHQMGLNGAQRVLNKGGSRPLADSVAREDDAITKWMNGIELRLDFCHMENRQISKIQAMLTDWVFPVVEHGYSRIFLRFSESTARTRVSPKETKAPRNDFLDAPAVTREAFQVVPVHDDIFFS